jgi:hypothetical protein
MSFNNPVFKMAHFPSILRLAAGALFLPATLALTAAPSVPPAPVALRKTEPVRTLNVTNNHPFAIREMLSVPVSAESENAAFVVEQAPAGGGAAQTRPLQLHREDGRVFAWLDVSLDAGASARYSIRPGSAPGAQPAAVIEADAFASGLPKIFRTGEGVELPAFDLLIVEDANDLKNFHVDRESRVRAALVESAGSSPLHFRKISTRSGPALTEFCYEAEGGRFNDYTLRVVHRVHAGGAIDTDVTVRTRALRTPETYLAIAKLMPAPRATGAVVRWKGDIVSLPAGGASPPRATRSDNWTRDVNWLAFGGETPGRLSRPLLARNVPGLTRVHKDTLRNANDFLVNEYAVGTADGWALLGEIAREHHVLKNYIPVYFEPPAPDEPLVLEYRTLPPGVDYDAQAIDAAFTAFAGYQGASLADGQPGVVDIAIGVAGVQFGTSYFPNSTFAENFEFWRADGIRGGRIGNFDVHRWWPVFKHPLLFKEEIRRDMRIVNSFGLDWIRIHHFDSPDFREDYIQTGEGKWMLDYIEFMAETARECGLGIFLDFSLSPNDIALVARRFGDVIKYYEIQNEALIIPGAKPDRFDYWMEARDRIWKERPGAPVFVTGAAQFFALYDGLERRGVTFNATGQHSYVDRREVPAHFRDIAVSLGGYASRRGTHALNSEYNWRMITRETEEAQAEHFTEIATHLFAPRGMPLAFEFQFQETFCVPPRTRGALRHYEPLRVDRTPKPQAFAYMDIIRKYGAADNRLRQLDISVDDDVRLAPGAEFSYNVTIRNVAARPLSLKVTQNLPAGFAPSGGTLALDLKPGETRTLTRKARAATELKPGVYHFFAETRYDDDVYFGWGIARHVAKPQLDLDRPVLRNVRYEGGVAMLGQLDLSAFASSVFGEEAPALEVDWALYLYHSLRCATGAPVTREKDSTLPAAEGARKNLVVVGTPASNALVKAVEERLPASFKKLRDGAGLVACVDAPLGNRGVTWLVVTGADAEGVERAASDLLYRYWRFAKDAASFREGMPPIEGSWAGTEPERKPARRKTTKTTAARTFESVVLRAPATAKIGEELRVIAMESAEPPGPAGGLRIGVYLGDKRVRTAVTNATGEVVFQLDAPGEYEIRAEKTDAAPRRISVTQ